MSFTEPDQETEEPEESPQKLRRQLGQMDAERKRLEAELTKRDRELAFTKVGLPNTPMAQFFASNYQGDASEEAIRAQAAELGLIGAPDAGLQQQVAEIAQQSAAAVGAENVMPADQAAELDAALRAVPPGPFHAKQIELVLQQYGRPTMLEET